MQSTQDKFTGRRVRLRTLTGLRWIAIAGQITAVVVATEVFGLKLDIGLCSVVIGVSILANVIAAMVYEASHRLDDVETTWALIFDLWQLYGLLALTGGLHNPFALLIIAPVTIGATILPLRLILVVGLVAAALVVALRFLFAPLVMNDGTMIAMPMLFADGFLAAILIGVAFLSVYAGRITAEIADLSGALQATQMALAREQKLTDLGGVVAAAAHELGTPLATIMLASAELEDELSDREDLIEDARLIRAQADRCRVILRSMGRAGKDDRFMRTGPLSEVLREAAEPHSDRSKAIVIEDGGPEQPTIFRRPEIIHGVRNLIQNAVDFATSEVVVESDWNETSVTVRISDDGPGFPQQVLSRIGEPFMRSRGRRNQGYEGMGLGLFIAKTLLERSGAELSFVNAGGAGGAVVELRWPRNLIEAPADETRSALGPNENFVITPDRTLR